MELQETATLELIQETATKAKGAVDKVAIISLPNEPSGVYGLVKADGSFERVVASPQPRSHKVHSLDQVPLFVEHANDVYEGVPSIWYSATGVVVLINDGSLEDDLRPRATCDLTHTPEFIKLQSFARPDAREFDAKTFIRMFRLVFSKAVDDLDGFLKPFRALTAQTNSSASASNGRNSSSLGRSIEASVQSASGEIPDFVDLNIRIFDDPALQARSTVRCLIDVDPSSLQIMIVPEAGELDDAIDAEVSRIGEILRNSVTGTPVFYGTP